jgi:hypothetical protein
LSGRIDELRPDILLQVRNIVLTAASKFFSKESIMANKTPKANQQRRDAKAKKSAIVKPMLKTGLPPGISEDDAKNPGKAQGGGRVKNNS